MRQCFLADLSRSEAKHNRCGLLRRCIKIDTILSKKYDHRGERRRFVAVNERMIARNAKSIGGSKDSEIGFAVGELIDRFRKCGFEKPDVTDPVGAAERASCSA
jgi:hypothetical protein